MPHTMGSIRVRQETGTLFLDFRVDGKRVREQTTLNNTPANRRKLERLLARLESEVAANTFDFAKTFGHSAESKPSPLRSVSRRGLSAEDDGMPLFRQFAETWFRERKIEWRRSYVATQRGALDKHLLPEFGERRIGDISKADILEFRGNLSEQAGRQGQTLSSRRINSVLKPLRQILNEAADRIGFTSPFQKIKPLKVKRSDVLPFTLSEVQQLLGAVRPDFRPYLVVRLFTGLRTGEVHGLKWKYVDFEAQLILVRESIVLGEEDDVKTDGSHRDIHMSKVVHDALREQYERTKNGLYVFVNSVGRPIDNKNFVNRVWAPLLRKLGLLARRPYQMRHTAATLWLAAGESPEWIARQLGHTTTEMLFRVYSRFVPNLTRQDGTAFDRLIGARFDNQEATTPNAIALRVQPSTRVDIEQA